MDVHFFLSAEIQSCGSGFPRRPRLSESDGGQAAANRHSRAGENPAITALLS